jgi:hypothetical protein
MLWGFAILSNDLQNAEWGYVSFSELKSISFCGIEIDCELEEYWKVRRAAEVEKIRIAHGWPRKNPPPKNGKESELIMKVKAGHFPLLLDLFAEVTNPYSDYFGMDPILIWEKVRGQ